MYQLTKTAEAIIRQFKSDGLDKDLTGGLWFQRAPQNPTFPYGVFYFLGTSYDEIAGAAHDTIIDISVQFNLFSDEADGGEEVLNLCSLLSNTFDWAALNHDDYQVIKCQREGMTGLLYTDEIWQVTLQYEISIIKE